MTVAFSDAYARILKATGCDGQEDLSQTLGISQAIISDSRRRGKVSPEILLALLEEFALDPHWVRTGEGSWYFDPRVQLKRVNARLTATLTAYARLASEQTHEGEDNE